MHSWCSLNLWKTNRSIELKLVHMLVVPKTWMYLKSVLKHTAGGLEKYLSCCQHWQLFQRTRFSFPVYSHLNSSPRGSVTLLASMDTRCAYDTETYMQTEHPYTLSNTFALLGLCSSELPILFLLGWAGLILLRWQISRCCGSLGTTVWWPLV